MCTMILGPTHIKLTGANHSSVLTLIGSDCILCSSFCSWSTALQCKVDIIQGWHQCTNISILWITLHDLNMVFSSYEKATYFEGVQSRISFTMIYHCVSGRIIICLFLEPLFVLLTYLFFQHLKNTNCVRNCISQSYPWFFILIKVQHCIM